ncbi:DUF2975 domain-containing protein [Ectobacillus polymachus]|uniref:DUF2975 domain-containing protein n=1 Tax=Ectobacillus polymachus TaxID=1508806 RepID=UPI003A8633A2
MKKLTSSIVLNILLIFGLCITIVLLIGTPLIITAFFKSQFGLLDHYLVWSVSACIYLCAIPYVILLFKLKKLSDLVVKNNPFSNESVKSLKVIAISSFSEVILFIGCVSYLKHSVQFFQYTVFGGPIIVVVFISITIGLLCFVLARLFEIAIDIKNENDLTI